MITCDNWPDNWKNVPAGTEISEEVFDQMLNVMPPIYLRKLPYYGFQMGEPHDHREKYKLDIRPRPVGIRTWMEDGKKVTNYKYVCSCGCSWERTEEDIA